MKIKSMLVSILMLLLVGNLLSAPSILSYSEFNGTVGTSYQLTSNEDTTTGDIFLDNFDLSLGIAPSDFFSAYLGLIYDGSLDSFEIDEAYAKVRLMEEYSLNLQAGKFYQPTSITPDYSNFITDSNTYMFTEILDLGLKTDVSWNIFTLSASFFKENLDDDQNEANEDTNIDAFVLNLVSELELTDGDLLLNASYISNIMSSSTFLDDEGLDNNEEITALSLGAAFNWRVFSFLGEFALALDEYNEQTPTVVHTELGYAYSDNLDFGLQYGMTKEAEIFPETNYGGIINYTFLRNSFSSAKVSAEYIIANEYNEDIVNTATLKLTYEF